MNFLKDKKLMLVVSLGLLVLIPFGAIMEKLLVNDGQLLIKVVEKKGYGYAYPDMEQPLKTFSESTHIYGQPYLEVLLKRNSLANFFEPGFFLFDDAVYSLLIISILIIFLVRVRRMDIEKPFPPQLVNGIRSAALACIVFAALDYFRLSLINKHILAVTEDSYKLEKFSFLDRPCFFVGMLLFWLYKIMKQGEVLQKEQDLTV